jgi:hypothetical protein
MTTCEKSSLHNKAKIYYFLPVHVEITSPPTYHYTRVREKGGRNGEKLRKVGRENYFILIMEKI